VYRALDPAGRGVEHEHVTTLIGNLDEGTEIKPNPNEVAAWKWMEITKLTEDMKKNPDIYAPWFHLGLPKVLAHA
jgi:isopentenyl-diphosphate delta-isomerase